MLQDSNLINVLCTYYFSCELRSYESWATLLIIMYIFLMTDLYVDPQVAILEYESHSEPFPRLDEKTKELERKIIKYASISATVSQPRLMLVLDVMHEYLNRLYRLRCIQIDRTTIDNRKIEIQTIDFFVYTNMKMRTRHSERRTSVNVRPTFHV